MIVDVLLTLLWLVGAVYLVAMFHAARAKGQLSLDLESIGLGAVTNFFDALGIGSFAPTTAYLKLRKMVPDSNLMPGGGSALSLAPSWIAVGPAAHVVLGALMTFGIGLYAPSLIMLSLMGLDPKAAFPIMIGACAFLMPVSGIRFINTDRIDMRVVGGIALGGIPAVLIAAYAVTSMPLVYLRWGVVAVVLYAAVVLLRAALRPAAVLC
jgi:hypothetical protein